MAKQYANVALGHHQLQQEQASKADSTSPTPPAKVHTESDDYVVYLVNMGNNVITRGCYNWTKPGPNNWFTLPTTPRNCTSGDCSECVENQNWTPILNLSCREVINLTVATDVDAQGRYSKATFDNLTFDCQYSGGGICVA